MASQDDNSSVSCQTRGKPPHVPKMLGDRGGKLLADAQRVAKATSKQRSGQLSPEGEDDQDITIERLQAQLMEMVHILVDNQLMKPSQMNDGEPSKVRSGAVGDPLVGACQEKQCNTRVELESHGDNMYEVSSK